MAFCVVTQHVLVHSMVPDPGMPTKYWWVNDPGFPQHHMTFTSPVLSSKRLSGVLMSNTMVFSRTRTQIHNITDVMLNEDRQSSEDRKTLTPSLSARTLA